MSSQPFIRFITALVTICALAGLSRANASGSQTVNSGWLLEAARNFLLTSDPWASAGCTVEIDQTPSDITVYSDGLIEVQAVLDRTPNGIKDIGAVSVEVRVDGTLYLRFDPNPYLKVTVPVYAAAREIERGQVLTEDDVEETIVDVKELPSGDICRSFEEIAGLAARTDIPAGRVLTSAMVELPILVVRGDAVTVVVPIGAAAVTLHGVALDSGRLGEEIRVRNPDSNAIITAVVTGQSRAEINILD